MENYYLSSELEARLAAFVDYYDHERYHESLDNVTAADFYVGRAGVIL